MGVYWDCVICGGQTKSKYFGEDICDDCINEAMKIGIMILKENKKEKIS
jgi:hypothetical protein